MEKIDFENTFFGIIFKQLNALPGASILSTYGYENTDTPCYDLCYLVTGNATARHDTTDSSCMLLRHWKRNRASQHRRHNMHAGRHVTEGPLSCRSERVGARHICESSGDGSENDDRAYPRVGPL